MAIDVQPPNLSGLTALAGRSEPLNIQPTGALGLQALQQMQQQEQYLRSNALAQQQLQQQGALTTRGQNIQQQTSNADLQQRGQLALGSQDLQKQALQQSAQQQQQQGLFQNSDLDLRKQALAQSTAASASDLDFKNKQLAQQGSLGQQGVNVDQAKLGLDQQKIDLQKATTLHAQDLQNRGAYASYAAMAMKTAQTPEQANQIRASILQDGLSKGYYTKDQIDQASQMPISQFTALTQSEVIKYGTAKDYQDMMAANKPAANASGLTQVYDPQSGKLVYSSTPTKAEDTTLQKDVVTQDQLLNTLVNLKNNFNPKNFTWGGRITKLISEGDEKMQNLVPGAVGDAINQSSDWLAGQATGLNAEQRKSYIDQSTQYLHSAGQIFQKYVQQMAGSRPSAERVAQFEAIFANPGMAPTEYKAGITQLARDIKAEKEGNQSILKNGLNVTPNSPNPYTPDNAGLKQHLQSFKNSDGSAKYSDQEIDDYISKGGK